MSYKNKLLGAYIIYIHNIYMPQTCVHGLPFSFGKGSSEGATRSKGEHEGAAREQKGAALEQERTHRDRPVLVLSLGRAQ